MIRITKPGKTIRYKFVCDKCGCEYTAEQVDVDEWRFGATCNCPVCGEMNFSHSQYEED